MLASNGQALGGATKLQVPSMHAAYQRRCLRRITGHMQMYRRNVQRKSELRHVMQPYHTSKKAYLNLSRTTIGQAVKRLAFCFRLHPGPWRRLRLSVLWEASFLGASCTFHSVALPAPQVTCFKIACLVSLIRL